MENPYYVKGTDVLKNLLDIDSAAELRTAEDEITTFRLAELRVKPIEGKLDYKHLKSIHKHIFGDLYEWAGKERTIPTEKGGHRFQWPEIIEKDTDKLLSDLQSESYLQNTDKKTFVEKAAHYFGELNFIHPFPEGNGRTQRAFFDHIAERAGYDFAWNELQENELLNAAIHSYAIDNSKLEQCFDKIVTPIGRDVRESLNRDTLSGHRSPLQKMQSDGLKPAPPATVVKEVKEAKSLISEATDANFNELMKPLLAVRKNLQEKVDRLKEELRSTSTQDAKKSTQDRLNAAKGDLQKFDKSSISKGREMRAEATRLAKKQNPQATDLVAKYKANQKTAQKTLEAKAQTKDRSRSR